MDTRPRNIRKYLLMPSGEEHLQGYEFAHLPVESVRDALQSLNCNIQEAQDDLRNHRSKESINKLGNYLDTSSVLLGGGVVLFSIFACFSWHPAYLFMLPAYVMTINYPHRLFSNYSRPIHRKYYDLKELIKHRNFVHKELKKREKQNASLPKP